MAEGSVSALAEFVLLAKGTKGAACAQLVSQVLEHPSIYVFGELLDVPNVQELASSGSANLLELLKIFAYGTWSDYTARAQQLGPLTPAQATKLKKLSIVTLTSRSKSLDYSSLLSELEMPSVRALEDLLIDCIYEELISAKLDQQAGRLDVRYSVGRDLHPSELAQMSEQLTHWDASSRAVLDSIREKLNVYKAYCESANAKAAELNQNIEEVRTKLRAQQEEAEGGVLGSYDGEMDFDEDKLRKSGRTKAKYAMGVGPRK